MKKPELLAPGGSYEAMRGAVSAGADAVYMGGRLFGARAYADNPDDDMLIRAVDYCHTYGKKLYLTVNTLLKDEELENELYGWLRPVYEAGVDAVLVQDLGVLRFIRTHFPELPIHASTQMSIQSADGARLAKELGCSRIVPARELSLDEIRKIIGESGVEVECFIHGALCYCYSGQCLSSSLIGGRSGNRGRCAQTCRLPGAYKEALYPLSLKDICTLRILPDLIDAKIASFKIEGRMKRPEYAAGVVSVYRRYIDLYTQEGREGYRVDDADLKALMDLFNRGGFSEGYYYRHNGREMMSMKRPGHAGTVAGRAVTRKDGLYLKAAEDLWKQDVLEAEDLYRQKVRPGDRTEQARSRRKNEKSMTLGQDAGAGELVLLPAAMGIKPGGSVLRMKSEKQLADIRDRFLSEDRRMKIKGKFILSPERPAILSVCLDGLFVMQEGPVPEAATGEGIRENDIRKQLMKTKDTPFEFEEITCEMEGKLFMPVSALNEMRRKALSRLLEERLRLYRRSALPDEPVCCGGNREEDPAGKAAKKRAVEAAVHVLITDPRTVPAVLDTPRVSRIYLDSMCFMDMAKADGLKAASDTAAENIRRVKESGRSCFIAMPWLWRDACSRLFKQVFCGRLLNEADGFLIRHADQIPFLTAGCLQKGKILAADSGVYVWNREAKAELEKLGVSEFTLNLEQNRHELCSIADRSCELTVYGYAKVMISSQCLQKNLNGCTHTPSLLFLKDRTGRKMPVLTHCGICMNTVYNSEPLYLCDLSDDRLFDAVGALRYDFTVESSGEIRKILEGKGKTASYTRGHFNRGVE